MACFASKYPSPSFHRPARKARFLSTIPGSGKVRMQIEINPQQPPACRRTNSRHPARHPFLLFRDGAFLSPPASLPWKSSSSGCTLSPCSKTFSSLPPTAISIWEGISNSSPGFSALPPQNLSCNTFINCRT